MRYTMTVVEQLDRAAAELRTDHPINNRLALILVDNAAELVMHRRCTDKVAWDKSLTFVRKLTPEQYRMATGPFLEGKLRVLEDIRDINGKERRFITIAHDYRNELYHVGLKHDDIIRSLAHTYFLFTCELFVRLKPSYRASSSDDRYTDVAERYLSKRNGHVDFLATENEQLADRLRAALPPGIEPLPATLANSALDSIEELVRLFEFLVADNPAGLDNAEVLRMVQWDLDLRMAMEREGVEGTWLTPGYLGRAEKIRDALQVSWRQRHTSFPTHRWRLRARALVRQTNPLVALDLYQALRNDMAYLEEAIDRAAGELDAWIQLEIDRARGK